MNDEQEKEQAVATAVATTSYDALLALTDAQVVKIRLKERSLKGSEYALSFFGSVDANATGVFVSKQIPGRFAFAEIEAVFETGASDKLAVYFVVSTNGNNDTTGKNVLSDYSQAPYFAGDSARIKVALDPSEFAAGQYIKVYGVNSSSGALNVNARVRIKVYPLAPQSNE